jgi:hypothetical protein
MWCPCCINNLRSTCIRWDDDDMDGLPGMAIDLPAPPTSPRTRSAWPGSRSSAATAASTPPDSPAKRLKRGFEQLELAEAAAGEARGAAMSSVSAVAAGEGQPLAPGFLDSRRTLSTGPVSRVAIVGGTHGNEKTCLALAQHFIDCPEHVARPSFETVALIGNPASVEANRRYVDVDMNRCFEAHVLDDAAGHDSLEHRRARELNELLGPKRSAEPHADFIFDLHNTTAQTGVALMLAPGDAFAHEVANHLMEVDPAVRDCCCYGLLTIVCYSLL